jgi:hypothetical protein
MILIEPAAVALCPPQNVHVLIWDATRVAAVGSLRLVLNLLSVLSSMWMWTVMSTFRGYMLLLSSESKLAGRVNVCIYVCFGTANTRVTHSVWWGPSEPWKCEHKRAGLHPAGFLDLKLHIYKLRGVGPLANYADRATAARWPSSANFLCG